ncbi:hypothetical protein BN7_5173 [Wickerhamomyces ciferrii]|uniref:Uncharacterized protein n=1 Tax=Wickerhamomyces ciferrii (strain ATCC 14091 / BCRC 22168 / CBS 111 / JCM 3599 / NBRC 0793 / NRRL Y-1031 F-60-10) TaxID=1206466 RepID=K0KK04_WICCF|nr:uncharacterized protein BN7_5173 [Wickerhamomyces ciferrii]CCH45590.1 hypothetical protein BN7_5173 [Wickerhamomyces ciferrii]
MSTLLHNEDEFYQASISSETVFINFIDTDNHPNSKEQNEYFEELAAKNESNIAVSFYRIYFNNEFTPDHAAGTFYQNGVIDIDDQVFIAGFTSQELVAFINTEDKDQVRKCFEEDYKNMLDFGNQIAAKSKKDWETLRTYE